MNPETSLDHGNVRVLGVIPARGGSKGIPRKNLQEVCGKPLIVHAIDAARGARLLDATIVSTDDLEIQSVAMSAGADAPFLRPAHLAADDTRDVAFLKHALDWVLQERGWAPEIVVLLPPTSPSRTGEDIDEAISLMDSTGASSVRTAVHPAHFNPYKMWVAGEGEGKIVPLLPVGSLGVPRQELPTWYMPVGIAYVMRADLIHQGVLWGEDVRVLPIPLNRYTDIDEPADLQEATDILMRQHRN